MRQQLPADRPGAPRPVPKSPRAQAFARKPKSLAIVKCDASHFTINGTHPVMWSGRLVVLKQPANCLAELHITVEATAIRAIQ